MALLFLLLLPVGTIMAVAFLGYAFGRARRRYSGKQAWLRSAAGLLGAVAAGIYTWGLLHVAGAVLAAEDGGAGSSPLLPCRQRVPMEQASKVVDGDVDFVPLRFVCVTTDGTDYAAGAVPGYVNVVVYGCAVVAALCAGAAAVEAERRAGPAAQG